MFKVTYLNMFPCKRLIVYLSLPLIPSNVVTFKDAINIKLNIFNKHKFFYKIHFECCM